jgi:hypothetical protein
MSKLAKLKTKSNTGSFKGEKTLDPSKGKKRKLSRSVTFQKSKISKY